MELKCIMSYNHSGFGEFSKNAYEYLVNTYGKSIADAVLTNRHGFKKWNIENQKKEDIYYPADEDINKARFNKYLIEIVEKGIELKYCISQGKIEIDCYDGADRFVRVTF